jgi:topoisomerase-4 subunit A
MTTKETVAVDDGLKPHTKHLKRAVTEDDILRFGHSNHAYFQIRQ